MLFLEKNKGGFTLIEIMLAVLIVSIGLVGIAFVFSRGSAFITEIRETSIAMQAASQEMELIRGMDFDDILTLGSSFTTAGFSNLSNPTGTLCVDNPFGTDDMRRVSITVSWTSPQGRSLSKSLVSLVVRDGINRQ